MSNTAPPFDLLKQFGKNIRKERQRAGISQETLADLAQLHRTHISSVERGQSNMRLLTIAKLAKALRVNVDRLTNGL